MHSLNSSNENIYLGNHSTENGERKVKQISSGKFRKFDETKEVESDKIEKISISTDFVDVNIKTLKSSSSKIQAKFYGESHIYGEVYFDLITEEEKLNVELRVVGNCTNHDLKLDIIIPQKTFKEISVNDSFKDIKIDENVLVSDLKLETNSGNIQTKAQYKKTFIKTLCGEIEIFNDTTKSTNSKISTMTGSVSVELKNTELIKLDASTVSGKITSQNDKGKDSHIKTIQELFSQKENPNGNLALLTIRTINGNINIG